MRNTLSKVNLIIKVAIYKLLNNSYLLYSF